MNQPRLPLFVGFVVCVLAVTSCSPAPAPPITTRLELRDGMRELWTAHVTWTRVFLIATIADLPDAPAATARLLQNQEDIGDAIRPFYGDAAGDRLSVLLREHILGAAALIAAARAGDEAGTASASAAWYANSDQVADFLAAANPHLDAAVLRAMMREHLDQTLAEATARLQGDWAADRAAYDLIVTHIEHMADALSGAIALQFPELVGPSPLSARDEELHSALRSLWQDHTTWTRVFLMSTIARLPDAAVATERLLQNQDDIGDALRPLYGDPAADQLILLLHTHITGAAELVGAAMGGDSERVSAASTAWYANADEIAAFLASANPFFDGAELRAMMREHLDETLAEATARLNADWPADVVAYDEVVVHILHMSDVLSAGVVAQFPR